MNVGIVGCGLIGRKRAAALTACGDTVAIVADVVSARAADLATEFGCRSTARWEDVIAADVDLVVVSTTNQGLHPVTTAALRAGKHVLCEKPLGRNAAEAGDMVEAARTSGRVLKTGFNHRHHPAIREAHRLAASGALGNLMFVRCVYGHGGRAGYDKEWRGNKEQAGGGELLDQGVHVIDLCRWFLGEFTQVSGVTARYVWEIAPLEDNAFATLQTASGQIASFHTSWTQWKNRFSFEVFGTAGSAAVEGLGGSYGPETLVHAARRVEGGAPSIERHEFPAVDESWHDEWREFRSAIDEQREPLGSGADGLAAARLIDAIYRSSANAGAPEFPGSEAPITARV